MPSADAKTTGSGSTMCSSGKSAGKASGRERPPVLAVELNHRLERTATVAAEVGDAARDGNRQRLDAIA